MKAVLRIGEAAYLLGVSTKTIRRWDQKGKISCFRTVGNHRRIRLIEVQRIISVQSYQILKYNLLFMPGSLLMNKNKKVIYRDKLMQYTNFVLKTSTKRLLYFKILEVVLIPKEKDF